jgi:hypothetical protein
MAPRRVRVIEHVSEREHSVDTHAGGRCVLELTTSVGKILRGTKLADIPAEYPMKYELREGVDHVSGTPTRGRQRGLDAPHPQPHGATPAERWGTSPKQGKSPTTAVQPQMERPSSFAVDGGSEYSTAYTERPVLGCFLFSQRLHLPRVVLLT